MNHITGWVSNFFKWCLTTLVTGIPLALTCTLISVSAFPGVREYPTYIVAVFIAIILVLGTPPHYSTILYREKGIIKGSLIQIIASALGAAVTIGLLMIVIYIFFPMLIPIILHQIVKIWMIVTLEAFLFQIFDIGWTWIYSLIG